MEKKISPLEAFKRIILESVYDYKEIKSDCNIVETALKDYEQLKIVAKPLTDKEKKSINSVARRLKALEIIKEKCQFFIVEDETPYNGGYRVWDSEYYQFNELTKEEFDLLKEVLHESKM